MPAFWSPILWSQAFLAWTVETGDESATACYHVLAISKQHNLQNAVLCEDRFAETYVLYAHLTYKLTRRSL